MIVLLIILLAMGSWAQGFYSQKNLEKVTTEDLSEYLTKALSLKKTGGVMTLVGSSTVIAGGALMLIDRETAFYIGFFSGIAGLGITAIGIPVLATGSYRVKRISNQWNKRYQGIIIDLVPYSFNNYLTRLIQPGISLKVRF